MIQRIIEGNCLEEMRKMADNSISAIVTDPPYGLSFMNKGWDHAVPEMSYWKEALRVAKPGAFLISMGGTRTFHRLTCAIEDAGWEIRDCVFWCYGQGFPKSHNFGCKCTGDAVPYNHEKTTKSTPESSLRPLPKSHVSPSFSAFTTENEIMFTSVPKQSLQSKRPMPIEGHEVRKESSLEGGGNLQEEQGKLHRPEVCEMPNGILRNGQEGWICNGTSLGNGKEFGACSSEGGSCTSQGSQHSEQSNRESGTIPEQSNSQDCGMGACQKCGGLIAFKGFGTSLKPAYEPIIMAMKPLDGTFKQNAEKWGQAGINIDGCRVGYNGEKPSGWFDELERKNIGFKLSTGNGKVTSVPGGGRWPANVIFDEEAGALLDEQSGLSKAKVSRQGIKGGSGFGYFDDDKTSSMNGIWPGDNGGGASRFFYCAKASSRERNEGLEELPDIECQTGCSGAMPIDDEGKERDRFKKIAKNNHPTVKPLKLMEYLIRLVMPPKEGILLDPFAGSGTTILAAKRLGFDAIGIEKQKEYCEIANKRVANEIRPYSPRV